MIIRFLFSLLCRPAINSEKFNIKTYDLYIRALQVYKKITPVYPSNFLVDNYIQQIMERLFNSQETNIILRELNKIKDELSFNLTNQPNSDLNTQSINQFINEFIIGIYDFYSNNKESFDVDPTTFIPQIKYENESELESNYDVYISYEQSKCKYTSRYLDYTISSETFNTKIPKIMAMLSQSFNKIMNHKSYIYDYDKILHKLIEIFSEILLDKSSLVKISFNIFSDFNVFNTSLLTLEQIKNEFDDLDSELLNLNKKYSSRFYGFLYKD